MEKQKVKRFKDIHLLIGTLLIFVVGWFCPTWGGISRQGVQAIFILIGGIWIMANHYGLIIPSVLMIVAICLTGFSNGNAIIASTLGGSIVWQLITIFVLIFAISDCDALNVFARWMISRKGMNGHPLRFSFLFLFAIGVMGALASALGAYLFGVAILNAVADTAGYSNKSQWKKAMLTGIIVMASVGGGIMPFKGAALMTLSLISTGLAESGIQIDQASYLITAIICGFLVCLLYVLSLKPLFRADFTKISQIDVEKICADGGTKFNRRQAITMGLFVLGILYSFFSYLPSEWEVTSLLSNIGQGTWFAFIIILMAIIRVEGKVLLDVEKCWAKAINWGVVLGVCAFTAVAMMISADDLGIKAWLSQLMNTAFGELPFVSFVVLLVGLTLLLTNVFSNTATSIIMATIAGPFFLKYGQALPINVACLIPGIAMSSLCAFLTMAAGGTAPIFLAEECMTDQPKWIWTYGLLVLPIVTIATAAGCLICAYIL